MLSKIYSEAVNHIRQDFQLHYCIDLIHERMCVTFYANI